MKNLFLAIISVFIMCSCNNSSTAQQSQGQQQPPQGQRPPMDMNPEKMSQMMTSQMKEKLGLNEDQEAKVGEINLNFATQMQEMMGTPGSQQQPPSREKMDEMQNKRNEELKKVLTNEQYEQMLQDQKERMKGGPGGPGGPGGQGGPDQGNQQ